MYSHIKRYKTFVIEVVPAIYDIESGRVRFLD